MPITLKTMTVFHCKCIRPSCQHEWDAFTKPLRCARCKYRSWNGEDHRKPDPFENVPVASQIATGTEAPQQPGHEPLLDSLVRAREVIALLIKQNPCNHAHNECVCAEKDVLRQLDQRIEKLRALQPRRSTYLVKKKEEVMQ